MESLSTAVEESEVACSAVSTEVKDPEPLDSGIVEDFFCFFFFFFRFLFLLITLTIGPSSRVIDAR